MLFSRTGKEPLGGCNVTPFAQEKVDSSATKGLSFRRLHRGSYGGVTIHATDGDDMERRLAAAQRRHVDQLTRDMEEVVYRQNRSNFGAGASAL